MTGGILKVLPFTRDPGLPVLEPGRALQVDFEIGEHAAELHSAEAEQLALQGVGQFTQVVGLEGIDA